MCELIKENWSARRTGMEDSNYHKNILVEEREFMRMERKLKKIGTQGGRGWGTAIDRNRTAIKRNWSAGGRGM